MNDIRKMLVDSITKIMRDYSTKEVVQQSEQGEWAVDLWEVLKESGMITVGVAEEAGGTGGSFGDALSMLLVAGKYSAPIPLAETYMANWLLQDLNLPVSEEPITIVPHCPQQMLQFKPTENGWEITGCAHEVPWARFAKETVTIGKSENGYIAAKVSLSACQIEPGVNVAGEPRDRITFDQVKIANADAAMMGTKELEKVRYMGALTRSVLMAGALERVLELTLAYSKERVQFGRALNRFQAIQQQLAILAGEAAAAGVAVQYAMDAFETDPFSMEIMTAKIRVGEAATICAPMAHQIHGAIGFTDEHILHQSTRRLWSWRDEFGTESKWAAQLGTEVLKAGKGNLWALLTSKESGKKLSYIG